MKSEAGPAAASAGVAARMAAYAESLGLTGEDLDDLVHDAKANEAAEINNGGLEDQLEYLASGSSAAETYLKDLIEAVASASARHDQDPRPDGL